MNSDGDLSANFQFEWYPGEWATHNQPFLQECAELYSNHYGRWSSDSPTNAGQPIRLSASRIREWLESPKTSIAFARDQGQLIGYAIAVQTKEKDYGVISWVSQLVVHRDYRNLGVAKTLLFSIWGFSDHFAWGLVSANPYAIRALEKATRRRCSPTRVGKNVRKLLNVAQEHVPYISSNTPYVVDAHNSRIDTQFSVDHSRLSEMVERVTKEDAPWTLGQLPSGWEWLAFTFKDQAQISLTLEELEIMLEASDQIVRQAYARMTLDTNHAWAKHAVDEVDHIVEHCELKPGDTVLDIGCGAGRHAIKLARKGMCVTAVDFVPELVQKGESAAKTEQLGNIRFIVDDCRTLDLNEKFDAVICLYDVIGTFAEKAENQRIADAISRHLKPGGRTLISVMNMHLTARKAKNYFTLSNHKDELLRLKPSNIMESTGDVFDPDYFIIDKETGIVYRKEQFKKGHKLPVELIVRDRRFTEDEITSLLADSNIDVKWVRFVRAGAWKKSLPRDHDRAKEMLILGQLSSN